MKAYAFTDQEVEDLCRQYHKNAKPTYEGGYVGVDIAVYDDMPCAHHEIDFCDAVRTLYPHYDLSPNSISLYDYGNIIFPKQEVACVILDFGE